MNKERFDCTVRATASVLGIDYSEAHEKLKSVGRRNRCRFQFQKAARAWGWELRPDLSCRTVEKCLPQLTNGKFVVRVSGHVFAVVDGNVHDADGWNRNARVKMVYQVQ